MFSAVTNTVQPKSHLRGTIVNFLDKFADSKNIPEIESWSIDANSFEGIGKKVLANLLNDISKFYKNLEIKS